MCSVHVAGIVIVVCTCKQLTHAIYCAVCTYNLYYFICRNELQKKLKNKHRLSQSAVKELQTLDGALTRKATELGLNIKDIKPTNRKIVTKCFNAIGMCVPVDKKLEIGYRPLTMTNSKFLHSRSSRCLQIIVLICRVKLSFTIVHK